MVGRVLDGHFSALSEITKVEFHGLDFANFMDYLVPMSNPPSVWMSLKDVHQPKQVV